MQSSRKQLIVTNADGWVGNCIALHLNSKIGGQDPKTQMKIVCLARDPSKCDRLKREGMEVHKVDYNDVNNISQLIRNSHGVIYVPEMNEKRVEWARNMGQAMKKERVHCSLIVSFVGADSQKKELRAYYEMEKEIKENCEDWCIVRKSLLMETFFLWSAIVQDKSEFPLCVQKDSQFAPLCLTDLCNAVTEIIQQQARQDTHVHRKQTYTLTGPQKLTAQQLVHELQNAIGGGYDIKFKEVSRHELENYLRSLRQRSPFTEVFNEVVETGGGGTGGHDKRMDVPNDTEINVILEYLEYVKEGKANFTSDDLKKITGNEGEPIRRFFEKHSKEFRPRS